jgi:predicted RNA-binding Zn ribbon-like protein
LLVMNKRQEAPGELERVRAFVNTVDIEEGTEELGSPGALATWLVEWGLAPSKTRATEADLAQAIELREALRAILLAHNGGGSAAPDACRVLDDAACRAELRLRFDAHGSGSLQPRAEGVDGALGRLLAVIQSSIAQGTWARLKACREPGCEWAFYDHTKNRSGAWCSMQVCGNRAKARTYRERRAGSPR